MSRKFKASKKGKETKNINEADASQLPESAEGQKKDKSPRVPQRDKIGWQMSINHRDDLTENQKKLLSLIEDKKTKIVFVNGPAGTSKTYISVLAGLIEMEKKHVSDILYIRSVIESASKSLGFLPGESEDKMEPYLRPLEDKLLELLPKGEVEALKKDDRIEGCPVNYLRGASFNARYVVVDEAQNLDVKELITVITRIGKYSKFIICGDPSQSDINGRSGFMKMFDLFNDESSREEGIHCFSFTKDDIVRSGVLKYIAERIENSGNLLK